MTETGFVPKARYMMRALELAAQAAAMGEVPVGAVVVQKSTGRIIGEGYNRREADRSPLAHAEIMAIDAASRTLGGWRLLDSALYVTLEPCPMCAGAILHARLEQVVYGTADPKGGAVDSVEQLFTLPYNWTPEVHAGLLQAECAQILRDFFRELRLKKQAERLHAMEYPCFEERKKRQTVVCLFLFLGRYENCGKGGASCVALCSVSVKREFSFSNKPRYCLNPAESGTHLPCR